MCRVPSIPSGHPLASHGGGGKNAPPPCQVVWLVDDPEAYVRTSVANHLNDISKDHPELTVEVAGRWLAGGTEGRTWIVNRGLRTLVKQGHEGALSLLGFGAPRARLEAIGVSPDPAEIGAKVELSATVLAACFTCAVTLWTSSDSSTAWPFEATFCTTSATERPAGE